MENEIKQVVIDYATFDECIVYAKSTAFAGWTLLKLTITFNEHCDNYTVYAKGYIGKRE